MSDGENEKNGDATGKREKNTTHEPSLSSLPSWKVVSESPWISDGRSNATEGKPSVEEEPKDGIPIGAPSRRRATKMTADDFAQSSDAAKVLLWPVRSTNRALPGGARGAFTMV